MMVGVDPLLVGELFTFSQKVMVHSVLWASSLHGWMSFAWLEE
jgi:hypothetical protein